MPSAFVDTNVLLYAVDDRDPRKQQTAVSLLVAISDDMAVSTQVLQEFYWNATKKLRKSPAAALEVVEHFSRRHVIVVTPNLIVASVDTSERYKISFWDAMIVEAAATAQCRTLYTEDLHPGQRIRGVRIQNPFK